MPPEWKPEVDGPTDVLDLTILNLLADPALIDGKGTANVRVLTDAQRRERQRARLDAQAGDSRKFWMCS